jgi:hypothetical protein
MSCSCHKLTCSTCNPCATSTTCTTPTCTPCGTVSVATPMSICVEVSPCTEGCEESISSDCVIYKGDTLGALGIVDGDSLTTLLGNLNTLLTSLILAEEDIPTYTLPVRCLASEYVPVTITALTKNGTSQILGSVQYPNAASALAFLQTTDAGWLFTAPNIFYIRSTDVWALSMACPS